MAFRKVIAGTTLYVAAAYGTYAYFKRQRQPTPLGLDSATFDSLAGLYDDQIGTEETFMLYGILRWWMVRQVKGDVLEISAGTGRNLPHYNFKEITSLTLTDLSQPMLQKAEDKYYESLRLNLRHPEHQVAFRIADAHCMLQGEAGPQVDPPVRPTETPLPASTPPSHGEPTPPAPSAKSWFTSLWGSSPIWNASPAPSQQHTPPSSQSESAATAPTTLPSRAPQPPPTSRPPPHPASTPAAHSAPEEPPPSPFSQIWKFQSKHSSTSPVTSSSSSSTALNANAAASSSPAERSPPSPSSPPPPVSTSAPTPPPAPEQPPPEPMRMRIQFQFALTPEQLRRQQQEQQQAAAAAAAATGAAAAGAAGAGNSVQPSSALTSSSSVGTTTTTTPSRSGSSTGGGDSGPTSRPTGTLQHLAGSCCQCQHDHQAAGSYPERCSNGQVAGHPLSRFPEASFDFVVDTFGLCSHEDPVVVLREAARVCRPGGQIILLQHGRSSYKWLNRQLDEAAEAHHHKWGCWWNRDILAIVEQAGLKVDSVSRWHFGTTYVIRASPVVTAAAAAVTA